MNELTEKEIALFEKSAKNHPQIKIGMDLYALVKQNKLKRVLEIGTGDWFFSLSMSLGGAWVVSLNDKLSSASWYGIMNSYQDKVFQVVESPRDYLSQRKSRWDVIFVNATVLDISDETLRLISKLFNNYLVILDKEGLHITEGQL